MKIALAQLNYTVADLKGNTRKIINAAKQAADKGAELVLFAEGAITGTPLFDLADDETFCTQVEQAIEQIAAEVPAGIKVAIGVLDMSSEIFENVLLIENGEIEFSEGDIIECGDMEFKLLISADHYSRGLIEENINLLSEFAEDEEMPILYINQCGASTDTIYYGGSTIAMPSGDYHMLPLFEEAVEVIDIENFEPNTLQAEPIELMHRAILCGMRDYFAKNHCTKACVALSGGIDSALVTALAVEALGAENVRVILLPSAYSSDHSVDDSMEMVRRLVIQNDTVSIAPIFDAAISAMQPIFDGMPEGIAEENMQSRIRLMLTMALSNKTGALMLNTSNKSEIAVGYGTLYGDTSGAISVLGDLYKYEVYALSRYINEHCGNPIPQNIIDKEPSAELRPNQRDSDSLPEYPILDGILSRLLEGEMSVESVIDEGFNKADVERVAGLLWRGDFKRHQLPPILRLSGATFGVDRIYPITKA